MISHLVHLQTVQKCDNTSACEKIWAEIEGYEHLGKKHHFVEKNNVLLCDLTLLLESPTENHLKVEVLGNV